MFKTGMHFSSIKMKRSRRVYGLAMGLIVLAGVASRSRLAAEGPAFVSAYAGDTLWALMAFVTLGFIFPKSTTYRLVLAFASLSALVELSQLYETLWLAAARSNYLGAVLLGHDFIWSDLVCYAAGITAGAILEHLAHSHANRDKSVSDTDFRI